MCSEFNSFEEKIVLKRENRKKESRRIPLKTKRKRNNEL
jgi:hypothetical protein